MHAAALHLQSKMSTLCCMHALSVTIWTHAYMYMYLPPNHLMMLCVVFLFQDTAMFKKKWFLKFAFIITLWIMCWKSNNALLKVFTSGTAGFFFRLIAYTCNIRTKFIFTCAGFLKRYFGSFVCFPYFVQKVNEDD